MREGGRLGRPFGRPLDYVVQNDCRTTSAVEGRSQIRYDGLRDRPSVNKPHMIIYTGGSGSP
jgi:hypothetical protein